MIASSTVLNMVLIPSHIVVKKLDIAFQAVCIPVVMAVHAFVSAVLIFSSIPLMKFLNPSQLSYNNLNAPANGFTSINNNPCQLFFTKSITPVKNPLSASTTVDTIFLIPSHSPFQKFLKPSHLFQSTTKIAIRATIAATISTIGFASIVAFKAIKAVLTVLITPAIFGTIVIIVPTAEITFPTTISTGPNAPATSATVTMTFFVPSSREFSQSTTFCTAPTILFNAGISN